jgi:hypothetical protein
MASGYAPRRRVAGAAGAARQPHPGDSYQKLCHNCKKRGHIAVHCTALARFNSVKAPQAVFSQPLQFDKDNAALARFRAKEQPTSTFPFPAGFDDSMPDFKGQFARFIRIGHETNTYIVAQRKGPKFVAAIWGETDDCDAAVRLLHEWSFEQTRDSKAKAFPKTMSYNFLAVKRDKFDQELRQYRQQYLQQPDQKDQFAGIYKVKCQLDASDPTDVLGTHLEAVDPIRMGCECYIQLAYDEDDHYPYFAVLGKDMKKIMKAAESLVNLHYNVIARQVPSTQLYFVKPVDFDKLSKYVYYEPYGGTMFQSDPSAENPIEEKPPQSQTAVMRLDVEPLDTETIESWRPEFSLEMDLEGPVPIVDSQEINARYLELITSKTMECLPFYMGGLSMRVDIGTCVFDIFPELKKTPLDLFLSDILSRKNTQENELHSFFTTELGDRELERGLLDRFFASDNLSAGTSWDTAEAKANPHCTLSFVIKSFEHGKDDYRLEADFPTLRDAPIISWSRVPRDGGGGGGGGGASEPDSKLLSVTLLDLQRPSLSYHVGVQGRAPLTDRELSRLPVSWQTFAARLKLDPPLAREPATPGRFFVMPDVGATVPLLRLRQRRAWRFCVEARAGAADAAVVEGYEAEVALAQDVECFSHAVTGKLVYTAMEPRWGVQVLHRAWDAMLSANERLAVGERRLWEAKEWDFFPVREQSTGAAGLWQRGSGCLELMRVLDIVADVVAGKD